MEKRDFSFMDHNTKKIIDEMTSQTKQIIKEIGRKTEVLKSKVKQGSGTNDSNIMDIEIEKEEQEEGNACFDKCFDDEVLDLKQRRKLEVSSEQTNKRNVTVGYLHGKLNVLTSNYPFPPMTCSQLTVTCLLGSVSDNVTPLWNLSSKEVKHINNGMIMWNMMKCFMSEVKRVTIEKVCWKAKTKDWDNMRTINV